MRHPDARIHGPVRVRRRAAEGGWATATAVAAGAGLSFREPVLPFAVGSPDDRRFRRILQQVLAAAAGFALALPWWTVIPPLRTPPPLPAPTARLVLPPAPPAPVRPPAPAPVPAPNPAATRAAAAEVPRPTQREASVAQARQPREQRPPGEDLVEARRRASGVGLLAARDQLAQLQAAPAAVALANARPGPGIGTGSGPGVGAGTEAGVPSRAWITTQGTQGSGGVQTAALSHGSGGGGLPGRGTTMVEGAIGGGGGGGPGGGVGGGTGRGPGGVAGGTGTGGTGTGAGGQVRRSASGKASRSIEDVRLVFERHKGAIYAMYQRALREDAGLQGKVLLELRIAPSGEVTGIRVVSTELKSPDLEARLLARVRQFDFGAKEVEPMVVTWPVDFLPS